MVALGAQLAARHAVLLGDLARRIRAGRDLGHLLGVAQQQQPHPRPGRGVLDAVAEDVVLVIGGEGTEGAGHHHDLVVVHLGQRAVHRGVLRVLGELGRRPGRRDVRHVTGPPHVGQRAGQLERQRLRRVRQAVDHRPALLGRRVQLVGEDGQQTAGYVGQARSVQHHRHRHREAPQVGPGHPALRVDGQVERAATVAALRQRRAGGAHRHQPGTAAQRLVGRRQRLLGACRSRTRRPPGPSGRPSRAAGGRGRRAPAPGRSDRRPPRPRRPRCPSRPCR